MGDFPSCILAFSDDSTSNGKRDFNNSPQKVTFSAGSEEGATISVNIEVLDDNIDEYVEGFILVLYVDTAQTSIGISFTPSKQTALVRIYDNDRKFHCIGIISRLLRSL